MVFDELDNVKARQNEIKMAYRKTYHDKGFVFINMERHTHTSLLADAGFGLQEIMERLGHKNDDVTKSVYLHVTKTMKKEASHKFEKLMENL